MFGKFFASTFTGSMFGAGPDVFAVWGYIVANTIDSTIELNPQLLAAILGTTPARIHVAIDALCAADAASRSPEANGARLVHESGFQYHVVNHAKYRALRNEEDRRAYNRDAKRRERARVKPNVNDIDDMSNLSAHTEAEAETEKKDQGPLSKSEPVKLIAPQGVAPIPLLVKLGRTLLKPHQRIDADFKEALKVAAAQIHLSYRNDDINRALDTLTKGTP